MVPKRAILREASTTWRTNGWAGGGRKNVRKTHAKQNEKTDTAGAATEPESSDQIRQKRDQKAVGKHIIARKVTKKFRKGLPRTQK